MPITSHISLFQAKRVMVFPPAADFNASKPDHPLWDFLRKRCTINPWNSPQDQVKKCPDLFHVDLQQELQQKGKQ
jgi:hypothetical protein